MGAQHIVTEQELYRAEVNGTTVLRVSAEAPSWAPQPAVNPRSLRWMLAEALRPFLCAGRASA